MHIFTDKLPLLPDLHNYSTYLLSLFELTIGYKTKLSTSYCIKTFKKSQIKLPLQKHDSYFA